MQQEQVAQQVAIIQKARQAVVPAPHDMLRDAGKVDASESGHIATFAARRSC
ncbi:hypothetical protein XGA_1015 [Xanthomonas hortorum ATCC 19865]|nr:hypothetical protein XGA_1015 [Xanthomonas hortorum ATCC 19865]